MLPPPLETASYRQLTGTAKVGRSRQTTSPEKKAPKLREPAASEETYRSVTGNNPGNSQKPTPCHLVKKTVPPLEILPKFSIKVGGMIFLRKQRSRSNMRSKKVRPGQTTFAAWCRWPRRDSSSRLLHHHQLSHEATNSLTAWNLSAGSRATCSLESNSMPSTVNS